MSKHAKEALSRRVKILLILLAAVAILGTTFGVVAYSNGWLPVFSRPSSSGVESADSAPSSSPPEDSSSLPPVPDPIPMFARPEEMRGAFLSAGSEYFTNPGQSPAAVREQIDEAFSFLTDKQFNTVLVPVFYKGQALYASQVTASLELLEEGQRFDPLSYILKQARDRGLYAYAVVDMGVFDGRTDPTNAEDRQKIQGMLKELAPLYDFDGYLLENYGYAYQKTGDPALFEQQEQYDDFNAFMAAGVTAMMKEAVAVFREESLNNYVGLLTDAVWAHETVDPRGSKTNKVYEEYTDGHADSLSWITEGWLDFVMVQNVSSTANASANFNTVLDWWNAVCSAQSLPLYIVHCSQNVGSTLRGWTSPDQLSRQFLACKEASAWEGSVYSSLSALRLDTTGSTEALLKAFDGTLMEEYIASQLVVSTPNTTNFTTLESSIALRGSADPNFPVLLNGKEITLSELGFFSETVELSPGVNTFTFRHKGQTLTYKITYKVVVLHSMTPTENLKLDGGSTLVISVIARKNATVYATINGSKVAMKASPLKPDDDSTEDLSSFENFTGSYTLPGGVAGREKELGAIKVTGTFNGLSDTLTGGKVTIHALPVTEPDEELPDTVDGLTFISPDQGSGAKLQTGAVVVVTSDYAEVFDAGTNDYSRPTNAYFPKGTTDKYVKTVTGSKTYYLLASGRRVYAADAALYNTSTTFKANALKNGGTKVSGHYTTLSFGADWRIPYNLELLPQKYSNPTGSPPKYTINNYGQTTEYIDITFFYTTVVPSAPDVSSSPLFSKAEWRKGNDNSYVLRLYLTKKGQFYGYSVVWDNDGGLHFSFKHPTSVASSPDSQVLQGVTIVLDPGHGGTEKAFELFGSSEKELNLTYSLIIRDKLEELGATVVMTRSTDVNKSHAQRVALARNSGCDLFLSIHMNASTSGAPGSSGTASGATVHYFNEYSYGISQTIADLMRAVEKPYGIGNRSQTVCWDPFYVIRVHDAPAILIECGFYDNPFDAQHLIDKVYQDKLTGAIVNGIVQYFQSLPTI